MSEPLYSRDILRLAASIPHLGRLNVPHGSAELRSPVCGSRVIADVLLTDGRVSDLGLEVSACAFGQASANLVATHAIGRTGDDVSMARDALAAWLAGKCDDPGSWPGLTAFERVRAHPGRHAAILLPFSALSGAISNAKGP